MDVIVQAYDGNVQMIDGSSVRVDPHAVGIKKGPFVVSMGEDLARIQSA